jgi:hypothetical protein
VRIKSLLQEIWSKKKTRESQRVRDERVINTLCEGFVPGGIKAKGVG